MLRHIDGDPSQLEGSFSQIHQAYSHLKNEHELEGGRGAMGVWEVGGRKSGEHYLSQRGDHLPSPRGAVALGAARLNFQR